MSFWQSKVKIRRSDQEFSKYIRLRDGMCVYKFKCNGYCDFKNLTCSHFIKRRYESTRFSPDNCDSACRTCHRYVEDTPEGKKELEEWKKKQLGEDNYKKLLIQAYRTTKKRDDYLDLMYAKELLRSLGK